MLKWFRKKEPTTDPAKFWVWFLANAQRIRDHDYSKSKTPVTEIGAMLRKYADVHAHQLTPPDSQGRRTLELSAEGMAEHVAAVKACVACAPSVPGWNVVAFRQRQPDPSAIHYQYEGHSLSVDTLRYVNGVIRGVPTILVTVPGFTEEGHDALLGIVCLTLDALLGEEYMIESGLYVVISPNFMPNHKPLKELPDELGLPPLP